MLKKWQCLSMALTLFVCMFTILAFTQAAAAQSVANIQTAKPAALLDCDAAAQRPVVYRGSIYARGTLSCNKSVRLRVQITLYRIVGDDLVRIGSTSATDRDDSLSVNIDRTCQSGRYRSEVIGYTWDVLQQSWRRISSARSEIVRAACFFPRS